MKMGAATHTTRGESTSENTSHDTRKNRCQEEEGRAEGQNDFAMNEVLIIACVVALFCVKSREHRLALFGALLVLLANEARLALSRSLRLHLLNPDGLNEALVLEAKLSRKQCMFLLDTGYAGPPVLSKTYLAASRGAPPLLPFPSPWAAPIRQRYREILDRMSHVQEDDEHGALNEYIQTCGCYPYTSGCTMKLMGIGSTVEQQADMLMCPMLHLRSTAGRFTAPKSRTRARADVFVTNSLKSSIHILTCDFLLHHSPCLICIERERLELDLPLYRYASLSRGFATSPARFSGGAFVATVEIGGVEFHCTVDTGAPGPICLGLQAASKIEQCALGDSQILKQSGVNGESICSQLIEAEILFCARTYKAPIFVNDKPTDHVDGYLGMGFLRAFDLLLTHDSIGFRQNSLHLHPYSYYMGRAAPGKCNLPLKCGSPKTN